VVGLALLFAINAAGQTAARRPAQYRDGSVLVGFTSGTSSSQAAAIIASVRAQHLRTIGNETYILRVAPGTVPAVIQALKAHPEVRYAEPDYQANADGVPNDPFFSLQWGLKNTGQASGGQVGVAGADEKVASAWDITHGSSDVVVAVLDTGIDYTHPDLATNVWSNPGGINGCAAGTHGYNVLTSVCDPMDDDTAYNGHGTHVSGIIGAVGNNGTGVAGVNWTTSLLAVKYLDSTASGVTSDLIAALDWVIQAKQAGVNIRVVNDSATFPGNAFSQALSDAIDKLAENDILFVTSAGNSAHNDDTTPSYPCAYARANEVCVAASDNMDHLWSGSNWGPTGVDLAAPGFSIYSTLRGGSYGYLSGTSMAAAEVSGAASLILSTGDQPVATLKSTILNSADVLPSLNGLVRTSGRLDVCSAIPGCGVPMNTALPAIVGTAHQGSTLTVSPGTWTANPKNYVHQWERCDSNGLNCSATGSTSPSYLLGAADVGFTMRVAVTTSNANGSSTATSWPTSIIVGHPDPAGSAGEGPAVGSNAVIKAAASSGVALVQSNSVEGSSVSALSNAFASANTAGDLIIAFVRMSTSTQTVAVTDTLGNTYTDAANIAQSTDGHQIHLFYAKNIKAGTNIVTATFSGTNNHPYLAVYEYSGLNALDKTAAAQGSSATASSGATAITTSANELVFAGLGLPASSTATVTAGSGFTLGQQDTNAGGSRAATENETASAIGSYSGSFTLSASSNWSAVVATFADPIPLTITTTSLAAATQNTAYTATLGATGGNPPYTWSVSSGSLPAGLQLTASTGAIAGTPSTNGTSSFTIQAKDSTGNTATQALNIIVNAPIISGGGPSITTNSLPAATQNVAYSANVVATGGATPYTWSLTSGALPAGLQLNANTGAIAGTPSTAGTSNFTVQVADSNANVATQALSIIVSGSTSGGPTITTTTLPAATQNVAYSATLAATGGATPYTWSVTSGTLPAGLQLIASTGVIAGTPTTTSSSNFVVQVADSNAKTASQPLSIQDPPAAGATCPVASSGINAIALNGVMNAACYPGATPCDQVNNARAALPSTGGIIDATQLTGVLTSCGSVTATDNGLPVKILLGNAKWSGSGVNGIFSLSGSGSAIIGSTNTNIWNPTCAPIDGTCLAYTGPGNAVMAGSSNNLVENVIFDLTGNTNSVAAGIYFYNGARVRARHLYFRGFNGRYGICLSKLGGGSCTVSGSAYGAAGQDPTFEDIGDDGMTTGANGATLRIEGKVGARVTLVTLRKIHLTGGNSNGGSFQLSEANIVSGEQLTNDNLTGSGNLTTMFTLNDVSAMVINGMDVEGTGSPGSNTVFNITAPGVLTVTGFNMACGYPTSACNLFGATTPLAGSIGGVGLPGNPGLQQFGSAISIPDPGSNGIVERTGSGTSSVITTIGGGSVGLCTKGTATLGISLGSGSATLDINAVNYQQCADTVTFGGLLRIGTISSPGGQVTITGLPVAAVGGNLGYSACSVYGDSLAATATTALQARVVPGATTFTIDKFAAGSQANLGGDLLVHSLLTINCTYFTQ
jgi:subtilisin family serine protease